MDRIGLAPATRDRLRELLKAAQDGILAYNREVEYTAVMMRQMGVPLTDEYTFVNPDEGWIKKEATVAEVAEVAE